VKVQIEIDTRTIVRLLLVISGFVALVFLLWKLLPALLIIAVSFFLAIALNKPVSTLSNRLPGHSRVLATALSYLVFVAVLGLLFALVVPPIIRQTTLFIDSLPGYVEQLSSGRSTAADFVRHYHLQAEVNDFVQGVQRQAGSLAQGVGSNVVVGVSTLLNGFVTLLTVLVLTFLMLIEGPRWIDMLWQSYSSQDLLDQHKQLVARMYRVVTGYVNGQVLVATIAGALASLGLFVLSLFFNLPTTSILPLGVIMLFTSLMPMIGATIGAIIILSVLVFSDIGAAIAFFVYFTVYQQVENNVIQPVVQSRTVELSALTVFIAALVGIMLLGLLGGILAIPLAGCLRVLALDYIDQRKKERAHQQQHRHKLAKAA
jgi:predicted PurR-regulated permease PerM